MEPLVRMRAPAVAGSFYPGRREQLERMLDGWLVGETLEQGAPKAIIAPHAGYVYSGPIAAAAYKLLRPLRGQIRRVVLLGPSHRAAVQGCALPDAEAFATPLGVVPLDLDAMRVARGIEGVTVSNAAHAAEHSLEVHLPFLQRALGEFVLVPFSVGRASADTIANLLDALWGGPETLIVVSSDLSHYEPYDVAQRLDRDTVSTMLALTPSIQHEQACGATPVNGLLEAARRHSMRARLLDLRNSGDTAGSRDEVVGYASLAFYEP